MNRHKQQGATAILMAVLVLGAVLVTTLTMSDIMRVNLQLERLHTDSVKSYFAAESGAEEFLWLVRNEHFDETTSCTSGQFIITNCLDPVACTYCHGSPSTTMLDNGAGYDIEYKVDGLVYNINITGIYSDVRRKIRLFY